MRTLLLTGYDDAMKEIGDITSEVMARYATRHGFDFLRVRQYSDTCHPSWQKVNHVKDHLHLGYDAVMWADADVLITDMSFTLRAIELSNPVHCSKDWGSDAVHPWNFSMGCFIAHRDRLSMWEELWDSKFGALSKRQWRNAPLWEQSAMQEFHEENMDLKSYFKVHDRRTFNAVHASLAPSAPEPWQPGDWLCHLTGEEITNEKRMVVLKELLNQIQE